jgi:acid phosphatase type 7
MDAGGRSKDSEGRVQAKLTSRRDVLKAALAAPLVGRLAAATVTLDRFPYLQNISNDRATVLWTARQRGSGRVEFGSGNYSQRVNATVREFAPAETGRSFTYYQYEARLTGLREGVEYNYRLMVDDQNLTPSSTPADELRFRTASNGPCSFIAIGDSGQGSAQQFQLATRLAAESVSLALHLGDIVYPDGTFLNYEAYFFPVYRDLMSRVPMFTVPGNHDYYAPSAGPYLANTSVPAVDTGLSEQGRFYSFDWGDVHFIALDTNDPLAFAVTGKGSMLDWLERDLQRSRKFWRIAFFHHPPYPTSPHHEDDETSALVRRYVVPILERYNVPLVLSGHDHNYQRAVSMRGGQPVPEGTGTQYIITGGGGASLFDLGAGSPTVVKGATAHHYLRADVNQGKAVVRAIASDGKELDRFELAPMPVVSSGGIVDAAASTPTLAPGSLFSIYGRHLALRDSLSPGFPLAADLNGIKVTFNNQPAPLIFASPGQINAQLPYGISGSGTLTVTGVNGSVSVTVNVSETAPGIFVSGGPACLHQSGSLVSQSDPAMPGEYISIYASGLGRVNSQIVAGQSAPAAPLVAVAAPVEVRLNDATLTPYFAGLAPGFAGLYQVILQIPANMSYGVYTLSIAARGAQSNRVPLVVGYPPAPPDPEPQPVFSPVAALRELLGRLNLAPLDRVG